MLWKTRMFIVRLIVGKNTVIINAKLNGGIVLNGSTKGFIHNTRVECKGEPIKMYNGERSDM